MEPSLKRSEYITVIITAPETHADLIRETIGRVGAGQFGHYAYCSFSAKGTGRFMPMSGAHPAIGTIGVLQSVPEERIEVVVHNSLLSVVITEIKKIHPYETTIIDMYPIYTIGYKFTHQ